MEVCQQLSEALQDGALKASSGLPSFAASVQNYSIENMPFTLPSIRSFTKLAFSSASFALYNNGVLGGAPDVCTNTQLSCHNTTAVANTCCFNAPGGLLQQTQFWDTNPATGPTNSWTIHGLWPNNCDGTYGQYCDESRQYTNITAILKSFGATTLLNYMNTYWLNDPDDGTNESFWEHEWGKHGTCISTLDTKCYTNYKPQEEVVDFFNKTTQLFQTLDTYTYLSAAGIVPSSSKTYTLAAINAALQKARGVSAVVQCSDGALDEAWYYFDVMGSVQTGTFVPTNQVGGSSSCPTKGIKYLPK